MQLLRQDEIADYCACTPEEHQKRIDALDELDRPCVVLPLLELCAQIHAQARRGRFNIPLFRECWERLVGLHNMYCYSGNGEFLILLADADPEEMNLARLVRSMPPLRMESQPRRNARDPEQESNEHKQDVLQDRLRALQDQIMRSYDSRQHSSRFADHAPPPDELPELSVPTVTGDLVLDTNVFVLLLMEIMEVPSGRPVPRRIFSGLSDEFYDRIVAPLSSPYGAAGKLIVPLSVLVEAEGVVRAKPAQHERAGAALDDLHFNDEHPIWNAFEFQRPDLDLLVAFLEMGESFMSAGLLEADWPFLGDMLVLAHGIANACPIASFEWVHKPEWARTGIVSRYPFLPLR